MKQVWFLVWTVEYISVFSEGRIRQHNPFAVCRPVLSDQAPQRQQSIARLQEKEKKKKGNENIRKKKQNQTTKQNLTPIPEAFLLVLL